MNKKIVFVLFIIACFSLVSCKNNDTDSVQVHIHSWNEWVEKTPATCVNNGLKERTCSGCSVVEKLNTNKVAHNYVEINKTEAIDCSSSSTVTYECSSCKEQYKVTLPSVGHVIVIDEEVAPTCTETGLTKGSHCDVCGTTLVEQKELPATGHLWGEVIMNGEVTCKAGKTCKQICKICNDSKNVYVPALEHKITVSGRKEATCTKDGISGIGVCDECGEEIFNNETLLATGHNFVNGECIRCKTAESKEGMTFTMVDGEYYLESVGVITDRHITVPLMYNNQYVVGILEGAFDTAIYAYSISLPKTIKVIEDGAFINCKMLQNVIVDPENEYYETIDKCLVESSTKTLLVGGANALIPEGIKHLANNAYKNHIGVTYIKIPSSIESIGEDAFKGCPNILIIEVDSKNEFYYSKDNCLLDKATNVLLLGCKSSVIPEGTEVIGSGAFAGCEMIKEIKIPDSVTTIMPGAYSGCIFVTKLEISASVTELTGAFEGLKNLTTIVIDENNPRYTVVDNCIMEKKTNTLVLSNSNAVIPEGTVIIGDGAFAGNTNITSIVIPETVTTIGARAFADCVALEKITFNKGLVTIGKEAFKNCGKLESFIVPRSLTTIEEKAFEGCKTIVRLEIPTSVTIIGEEAFKGCDTLIICGEAKSKPEGWHENYNPDGRPEFWNIYILK